MTPSDSNNSVTVSNAVIPEPPNPTAYVEQPVEKPVSSSPMDTCLTQANLIVIDDEPATTALIGSHLSRAGFQNVTSFNSAADAVRFLGSHSADIILLDIRMPEIDGISMLNFLRRRSETKFVPVIVLTSDRDDETRLNALNAGANGYVNKPVIVNELVARIKNLLAFRLHTDKIEREVENVTQELNVDALTGLHNRRAFDSQFTEAFPVQTEDFLSLIVLDIDKFKQVNDTYGHLAGDEVLRQIGKILRSCCVPGEFAARIGGDEFAIICRHTRKDRPLLLGDRIRQTVAAEPMMIGDVFAPITVSVGIATADDELFDKGRLFNSADSALYQSKHQGRNTINYFSEAVPLTPISDHQRNAPKMSDVNQSAAETRQAKILIIDDERSVTQTVQLQLKKAGYPNVEVENNALHAMDKIQRIAPDLVILDVRMPGINGLELLKQIRKSDVFGSIPVLVMTGLDDEQIRIAALKLRANDFLNKPAKPVELDVRVFNSLLAKFHHDRMNEYAKRLTYEIEVRTDELFATRRETILCMARAGESRDTETGNHVIRVGYYAAVIAKQMGMDKDYVGWIELAAQLHDVGKLSIPDIILRKPGMLDVKERQIIETHCDNADQIFFGQAATSAQTVITSPLLKMAARIASSHHEHWDGGGYPRALSGHDIPLEGRITAVADVFDALSSKRCYKEAYSIERCIEIMSEARGSQFDPDVFDAFIEAFDDILKVREKWQDNPISADSDKHELSRIDLP